MTKHSSESPVLLLRRSYADGSVDTRIPGWSHHCVQTSPGALGGGARELHIPAVQLLEERYQHVAINHYGVAAPDCIAVVAPLRFQGAGIFNGKLWAPGTICAWNTNREFNAITPPADLLCVILKRSLLIEHIAQTENLDLESALLRGPLIFGSPAVTAALATRVTELIVAAFSDWDVTIPAAQQAIRQELLETIAPLLVEQLDSGHDDHGNFRHMSNVRRAREVALARPDTPLQVQDLCRELHISRRTLQASFRAVLGISPLWYLRTLRLDGARRQLLGGCSVKDVAERWGFWHWSRFSHDYQRLFGELPSSTLKRAGAISTDLSSAEAPAFAGTTSDGNSRFPYLPPPPFIKGRTMRPGVEQFDTSAQVLSE